MSELQYYLAPRRQGPISKADALLWKQALQPVRNKCYALIIGIRQEIARKCSPHQGKFRSV